MGALQLSIKTQRTTGSDSTFYHECPENVHNAICMHLLTFLLYARKHAYFFTFLSGCPVKVCYNGGRRVCSGNIANCKCPVGFSGSQCKSGERIATSC